MEQERENQQPWDYEPMQQPEAPQSWVYETNQEQNAPQSWTYEAAPTPKKAKEKKSVSLGTVIALGLCFSLLGGILGGVAGVLGTRQKEEEKQTTAILQGQRENTVLEIHKIDTDKLMTPAEVYAANVNSTVGITTSVTTNFWGFQTTDAASGSGFIISKDGYILTNHHVIENSNTITVSFYDGSSKDATLVGYDASNDIAVLKVEAENLSPVVLGDSENLNVGDSVVAIGNPLGELTFSLTSGTLSALDRQVTTSNGVTMNLMQTDCAINSGNSGGALFNLYGEVIGITNAKYSGSSGSGASIDNIGFAIPINRVQTIVKSIIEKGYFSKPYIGVSVTDVSEETQSYGLPKGAAVKEITADSPAAAAGLQVNDIITAIDGKEISGSSDVVRLVSECEVGQTLTLTVFRQGNTLELELTVGEQIQNANQEQQQQQQQQQGGNQTFPFRGFGNY